MLPKDLIYFKTTDFSTFIILELLQRQQRKSMVFDKLVAMI